MKTESGKVLLLGAGDIGRRIIASITPQFAVTAVTSQRANRSSLKRLGAKAVSANLDRPHSLSRLPSDWQILIHCAPPPARGTRDSRTRNLLRSVALRGLERSKILTRVIIYLSTSGVYGDCGGAVVSEARALRPANPRAQRRVDAERRLARHAKRRGMHLIILRVPGIYAADRLPLERLQAGTSSATRAPPGGYTRDHRCRRLIYQSCTRRRSCGLDRARHAPRPATPASAVACIQRQRRQ